MTKNDRLIELKEGDLPYEQKLQNAITSFHSQHVMEDKNQEHYLKNEYEFYDMNLDNLYVKAFYFYNSIFYANSFYSRDKKNFFIFVQSLKNLLNDDEKRSYDIERKEIFKNQATKIVIINYKEKTRKFTSGKLFEMKYDILNDIYKNVAYEVKTSNSKQKADLKSLKKHIEEILVLFEQKKSFENETKSAEELLIDIKNSQPVQDLLLFLRNTEFKYMQNMVKLRSWICFDELAEITEENYENFKILFEKITAKSKNSVNIADRFKLIDFIELGDVLYKDAEKNVQAMVNMFKNHTHYRELFRKDQIKDLYYSSLGSHQHFIIYYKFVKHALCLLENFKKSTDPDYLIDQSEIFVKLDGLLHKINFCMKAKKNVLHFYDIFFAFNGTPEDYFKSRYTLPL